MNNQNKHLRRVLSGLLLAVFLLSSGLPATMTDTARAAGWRYYFQVRIGDAFFPIDLVQTKTTKNLESRMALSATMKEKGGVVKCRTFKKPFKAAGTKVKKVKAGDIVLKGDSCLMLCYKSFRSKKGYMLLGRLSDADITEEDKNAAMKERTKSWKNALAGASVKVTFSRYTRIEQAEAMQMMNRDDGHVIVDVRNEDEYAEKHIPGAILVSLPTIGGERPASLPDTEQILLVYCRSGRRSKEASAKLADLGYKNVYEFGGINTWPGATVPGSGAATGGAVTAKMI